MKRLACETMDEVVRQCRTERKSKCYDEKSLERSDNSLKKGYSKVTRGLVDLIRQKYTDFDFTKDC